MKRLTLSLGGKHQRAVRGSNALASFGLLAAGVVLGGTILMQVSSARLDITQDRTYTLSPASARLAQQLSDPAVVTLYFTRDLPASMNSLRRSLRDTLEEYRSASGGRLTIREVDPAADPDAAKEVARLGIPKVQFNTRTSEKISVQAGYLGLGLTYRAKNDLVLPVVQDISSFEYDFSTLLKKAQTDAVTTRSVRFLTGHGETGADVTQGLRRALGQSGTVSDLDLSKETSVPADTSLVIIAAAAQEIPEAQLKALDAYLMQGGKLLVFSEAVTVNRNLQPTPVKTGLEPLLAKYGITIGQSVVGDELSNDLLTFQNNGVQFGVSYPYLVKVLASNVDRESPIGRGIDGVELYWPTAISVQAPEGAQGTVLLSTTAEGGFVAAEPPNLMPPTPEQPLAVSARGAQPLAVSLSGSFPSAYGTGKSTGGRIIVIGDGDTARDDILGRFQGNAALVLNSVDWLSQDEDLIQIRSKTLNNRVLQPTTDAQRVAWKWGNLLAAPLVILVGGIVAWVLRRRPSA